MHLSNNRDDEGRGPTEELLPLAVAFAVLSSVATVAWEMSSHPAMEFDVDFYVALDRVLGAPPAPANGEIVELPPLRAGDQLVGAFFGPPSR